MNARASRISTILSFILSCAITVKATLEQCQADCRQPAPHRLVGPTRPWHDKDFLGTPLGLTKSYPYSTADTVFDIFHFNVSYQYDFEHTATNSNVDVMNHNNDTETIKEFLIQNLQNSLMVATNISFDLKQHSISEFFQDEKVNDVIVKKSVVVMIEAEAVVDHGSQSTNNIHFDAIDRALKNVIWSDRELKKIYLSPIKTSSAIGTRGTNPYSEYCELGCAYFYATESDPFHLSECLGKCDESYSYNVTMTYVDLLEVARLECRDGCHMALMRCKPGFYCSQVRPQINQNEVEDIKGGWMKRCPAGTYRDVSYDAVEECIPCPPGRYREESKGRRLDACYKCPPGTYNEKNGSSTINDCKRCPEGTFTREEGSGSCICITPFSCSLETALFVTL
jgi:hypothetical protein